MTLPSCPICGISESIPSPDHDHRANFTTSPTVSEPRTEAARKLLREIERLDYDAYDAGRAAFGSWEKAFSAIEDEADKAGYRRGWNTNDATNGGNRAAAAQPIYTQDDLDEAINEALREASYREDL